MLTVSETEMMARKLRDELGPQWRTRIWETDRGEWRYAVESKDGWWILSPHMQNGGQDGFAAYLRETPGVGLAARWMALGSNPYEALINTAGVVSREARAITQANKGCNRTLQATLERRFDPETPAYVTH